MRLTAERVAAARKAGHTDSEILEYLARDAYLSRRVGEARLSRHTDRAILDHLAGDANRIQARMNLAREGIEPSPWKEPDPQELHRLSEEGPREWARRVGREEMGWQGALMHLREAGVSEGKIEEVNPLWRRTHSAAERHRERAASGSLFGGEGALGRFSKSAQYGAEGVLAGPFGEPIYSAPAGGAAGHAGELVGGILGFLAAGQAAPWEYMAWRSEPWAAKVAAAAGRRAGPVAERIVGAGARNVLPGAAFGAAEHTAGDLLQHRAVHPIEIATAAAESAAAAAALGVGFQGVGEAVGLARRGLGRGLARRAVARERAAAEAARQEPPPQAPEPVREAQPARDAERPIGRVERPTEGLGVAVPEAETGRAPLVERVIETWTAPSERLGSAGEIVAGRLWGFYEGENPAGVRAALEAREVVRGQRGRDIGDLGDGLYIGADPAKPGVVPVEAEGRFAELSRYPQPAEVDGLRRSGFDGAIMQAGRGGEPQVVIWNPRAVKGFGNWRAPLGAAPAPEPARPVERPAIGAEPAAVLGAEKSPELRPVIERVEDPHAVAPPAREAAREQPPPRLREEVSAAEPRVSPESTPPPEEVAFYRAREAYEAADRRLAAATERLGEGEVRGPQEARLEREARAAAARVDELGEALEAARFSMREARREAYTEEYRRTGDVEGAMRTEAALEAEVGRLEREYRKAVEEGRPEAVELRHEAKDAAERLADAREAVNELAHEQQVAAAEEDIGGDREALVGLLSDIAGAHVGAPVEVYPVYRVGDRWRRTPRPVKLMRFAEMEPGAMGLSDAAGGEYWVGMRDRIRELLLRYQGKHTSFGRFRTSKARPDEVKAWGELEEGITTTEARAALSVLGEKPRRAPSRRGVRRTPRTPEERLAATEQALQQAENQVQEVELRQGRARSAASRQRLGRQATRLRGRVATLKETQAAERRVAAATERGQVKETVRTATEQRRRLRPAPAGRGAAQAPGVEYDQRGGRVWYSTGDSPAAEVSLEGWGQLRAHFEARGSPLFRRPGLGIEKPAELSPQDRAELRANLAAQVAEAPRQEPPARAQEPARAAQPAREVREPVEPVESPTEPGRAVGQEPTPEEVQGFLRGVGISPEAEAARAAEFVSRRYGVTRGRARELVQEAQPAPQEPARAAQPAREVEAPVEPVQRPTEGQGEARPRGLEAPAEQVAPVAEVTPARLPLSEAGAKTLAGIREKGGKALADQIAVIENSPHLDATSKQERLAILRAGDEITGAPAAAEPAPTVEPAEAPAAAEVAETPTPKRQNFAQFQREQGVKTPEPPMGPSGSMSGAARRRWQKRVNAEFAAYGKAQADYQRLINEGRIVDPTGDYTPRTEASGEAFVEPQPPKKPGSRVFTEEAAEQARRYFEETGQHRQRGGIGGRRRPRGYSPAEGTLGESLRHAINLGGYHFENGVRSFGTWSAQMVKELGEWVKPHLRAIWKEVRAVRRGGVSAEYAAVRAELVGERDAARLSKPARELLSTWDKVVRKMFDSDIALERARGVWHEALRKSLGEAAEIPANVDPVQTLGLSGNIASAGFEDAVRYGWWRGREKVAPGLQEIVKVAESARDAQGARRTVQEFETYATMLHARDLIEQGGRDLPPQWTPETVERVIAELHCREFQQAAGQLQQWTNELRLVLEEAHLKPEGWAAGMRAKYPNHVPLVRVVAEGAQVGGVKADVGVPDVVKPLLGGKQLVKSPLGELQRRARLYLSLRGVWQARAQAAALADEAGPAGEWVMRRLEEGPAEQKIDFQTARRLATELVERLSSESGVSDAISPELITDLLKGQTIFSPALGSAIENVIPVMRGGQVEFYQVHPDLMPVFCERGSLVSPVLGPIMKVLMGAKNVARATRTTYSVKWIFRNVFRDVPTAVLQSEGYSPMVREVVSAIGHVARRTPEYHEWAWSGGRQGSREALAMDPGNIADAFRAAPRRLGRPQGTVEVVADILMMGPRLVEAVGETLESGTRFAVAQKKLGKRLRGGVPRDVAIVEAATAGRVGTVPFERAGLWSRFVNQFKPFVAAGFGGPYTAAKYFKAHPTETVAKGLLYITLPAMANYAANRDNPDWQALPGYRKYGCLNWAIGTDEKGETRWVFMPLPWEWGLAFAAVPMAALEHLHGKDPNALREFAEASVSTLSPIGDGAELGRARTPGELAEQLAVGAVEGVTPTLLTPVYGLAGNRGSFGRPIVPQRLSDAAAAKQDIPEQTSEVGKALGKAVGMSPLKVDYVLQHYFGTAGRDVLAGIDDAAARLGVGKRPVSAADQPSAWARGVVGKASTYTDYREDFYSELARLKAEKSEETLTEEDAGRLKDAEWIARQFSQIRGDKRFVLNADYSREKKQELIDAKVREEMLLLTRFLGRETPAWAKPGAAAGVPASRGVRGRRRQRVGV